MTGHRLSLTQKPLVVGMVQITEPMLEFSNLPYASGLLQAYVQHQAPGSYVFLLPVFERLLMTESRARMMMADVVGFSTYVWNMAYSLELARRLKQAKPEILIVFGGPQVPDKPEDFMREHPFIDLCVHGEGEAVFFQLLERFRENRENPDYAGISGLSRRVEGQILTSPKGARLNIAELPSPYLAGVFDPLLLTYPGRDWVVIWETNRGCPYTCTFCDWGSAVATKLKTFDQERVVADMRWIASRKLKAVYCADSNFGILRRDLEITAELVKIKQQTGYPKTVYTQSAKNVTERIYQVQKLLLDAGLSTVATLSLQTVNPEALKVIRRDNISLETYNELQRRFRRDGVATYTDYLVGLPGETFNSFTTGIGKVIAQGQHREMRTWSTFILPNAEMGDPEYQQRHGIESVKIPLRSWQQPAQDFPEGILEYQDMIVSSNSYTREDWVQMRVFSWLTQLLYFGRALQVPMMLLYELGGVPYEQQLLAFLNAELPPESEVLSQLRGYFLTRAREMSVGGPEYTACFEPVSGKEVWAAADYTAAMLLLYSPRLTDFFNECRQLLNTLAGSALPPGLLDEALALSRALFLAQRPEGQTFSLRQSWNLWECYQQVLACEPVTLRAAPHQLRRRLTDQGEQIEILPLNFATFQQPDRLEQLGDLGRAAKP